MYSVPCRVPFLYSRTVRMALLYEQMLYYYFFELQTRSNETKAVIKGFIDLNFSLKLVNKDYISEQGMHFQKRRMFDKNFENKYEPEQHIKFKTIARTDVI